MKQFIPFFICFALAIGSQTAPVLGAASQQPIVTNLGFSIHESLPFYGVDGGFAFVTQLGQFYVNRVATGGLTNIGFFAESPGVADGHLVLLRSEGIIGQDANGDGDFNDVIPVLRSLKTGSELITTIACNSNPITFSLSGPWIGFEGRQPGFLGTPMISWWNVETNSGGTTGLNGARPLVQGNALFFSISEAQYGDLDGSGGISGSVLQRTDLTTGITTNLGIKILIGGVVHPQAGEALAVTDNSSGLIKVILGDGTVISTGLKGLYAFANDQRVILGASKPGSSQIASQITETKVYDFASGLTTVLPIGTGGFKGFGERFLISGFESIAPQDLNGDGDTIDAPALYFDPVLGQVAGPVLTPFTGTYYLLEALLEGSWLSQRSSEQFGGGLDLTGDGDGVDLVQTWVDLTTGVVRYLGDTASAPEADGALVAWLRPESAAGIDLNGDGDLLDPVLQVHDGLSGQTWNSGLATPNWSNQVRNFLLAGDTVLFKVSEARQGNTDLDGDGDANDVIAFTMQVPVNRGLTSSVDAIRLSTGGQQAFQVAAGIERGRHFFWLLGSLSGTSPGLNLGTGTLPLNPDTYLTLSLNQPNTAPFVETLGLLDWEGRTQAPALALPLGLNPGLAGATVHHACVAFNGSGELTFVSNAVSLALVP
jgi:hypothetical protein